jgi:hypothetical protein
MRAAPVKPALLLTFAGVGIGVGVALGACSVGEIDIANRECPCSAPGWVCDPSRNLCVPIDQLDGSTSPVGNGDGGDNNNNNNADAADAGPECSASPTDTCPVGRYCVASTLGCAPGCKTDDDCKLISPSSPFCNVERHQCVVCKSKSDCPSLTQDCTPGGSCAEKCTPTGGGCAAGELCCANLCVNPKTDVFNCNACGAACTGNGASSQQCCNGACANPLTSPTNCGTCGTTCSSVNGTPSCTSGSCKWTCNPNFAHCGAGNTGCETAINTVSQCGGCSTNCLITVKNATSITCGGSILGAPKCTYASCNQGFGDCNQNTADGCECLQTCGGLNQPCCQSGLKCNAGLTCKNNNTCQ